jgi:hypothetical protein
LTSRLLRVISHEMSEFEFHISPVRRFVAAPYGCRHLGHELEQLACVVGIVSEALWAFDRLGDG